MDDYNSYSESRERKFKLNVAYCLIVGGAIVYVLVTNIIPNSCNHVSGEEYLEEIVENGNFESIE